MPTKREALFKHAIHYAFVLMDLHSSLFLDRVNAAPVVEAFEREWGQIREAQDWAASQPDDEDAQRVSFQFSAACTELFKLRRSPNDLVRWVEPALRFAQTLGLRDVEGELLNALGNASYDAGDYHKSIEFFERALPLSIEFGDERTPPEIRSNLANAYKQLDKFGLAIANLDEALKGFCKIGDRQGEGRVLGNLGVAYAEQGESERAVGYYEQALAIAREFHDRRREEGWLGNLGNLYANTGRLNEARQNLTAALEIARSDGDKRSESMRLNNLGSLFLKTKEYDLAVAHLEKALAIKRLLDDAFGEGAVLNGLGQALIQLRKYDRAVSYLERSLDVFRRLGLDHQVLKVMENLTLARYDDSMLKAQDALSREDFAEAATHYERALEQARYRKDKLRESTCLGDLGYVSMRIEHYGEAFEYCEQGLALSREAGDRSLQANQFGNLGNIHQILGRIDLAVEAYEQAVQAARKGGDSRTAGLLLSNLGIIASHRGNDDAAISLFHEARRELVDAGLKNMVAEVDGHIARLDSTGTRRPDELPIRGKPMEPKKARELGLLVVNVSLRGSSVNATATLFDGTKVSGLLRTMILSGDYPVMTLQPEGSPALPLDFSKILSVSVRLDDGTSREFS
jgi:tetratricopeptide (TPR) repeat protein